MLPGLGEAAELRNERGSAHRMQIEAKATAFYLLICSHVWLFSHSLCKFNDVNIGVTCVFFSGYMPSSGVGGSDNRFSPILVSKGISILFSIMAVSVYISGRNYHSTVKILIKKAIEKKV